MFTKSIINIYVRPDNSDHMGTTTGITMLVPQHEGWIAVALPWILAPFVHLDNLPL